MCSRTSSHDPDTRKKIDYLWAVWLVGLYAWALFICKYWEPIYKWVRLFLPMQHPVGIEYYANKSSNTNTVTNTNSNTDTSKTMQIKKGSTDRVVHLHCFHSVDKMQCVMWGVTDSVSIWAQCTSWCGVCETVHCVKHGSVHGACASKWNGARVNAHYKFYFAIVHESVSLEVFNCVWKYFFESVQLCMKIESITLQFCKCASKYYFESVQVWVRIKVLHILQECKCDCASATHLASSSLCS